MIQMNSKMIGTALLVLYFSYVSLVAADAPVLNEAQQQTQEPATQHKNEQAAKVAKETPEPVSEAEKQKMRQKGAHLTAEQRRLNVASQDEAGHAPRNRQVEMREKFRNMSPDERRLAMEQRKNQAIAERAAADPLKRQQERQKHQEEMLALKEKMKGMTPEQRKQFMRNYKKQPSTKTKI